MKSNQNTFYDGQWSLLCAQLSRFLMLYLFVIWIERNIYNHRARFPVVIQSSLDQKVNPQHLFYVYNPDIHSTETKLFIGIIYRRLTTYSTVQYYLCISVQCTPVKIQNPHVYIVYSMDGSQHCGYCLNIVMYQKNP